MFTIIYVQIFVFVGLLFVADIIRAEELNVGPLELGTSGTIPCGHVESDQEVRLVQWYKSRNISVFENGDHSLAWWAEGESGSLQNYHMETTTFSLIIDKATLEDEGLYKCSVVRGGSSTRSNYFTRTVTYALPRMDPKITFENDLSRVHCTVEHVKPVIYPVLNFDWIPESTETSVVLNENGTYTTSVCCALPQTKSASRVDCSFSYLHYQRVISSDLRDTTTESPMGNKATTVSPIGTSVTFAGDGCTNDHTAIIVEGIFICLLTVTNFILLIMWISSRKIWHRGVKNCNEAKENEEKMMHPDMEIGAEVTA